MGKDTFHPSPEPFGIESIVHFANPFRKCVLLIQMNLSFRDEWKVGGGRREAGGLVPLAPKV